MPAPSQTPSGYLTLTLHAHLPYVVNHGTWPHGLEWLLEAAAETYLPLLRMFRSLERDGVSFRCNLNFTPVLLEQLTHPTFQAEFPLYLERKIASAREDEAFFLTTGELNYAQLARTWQDFFAQALHDFQALDGNIVNGFRELAAKGMLEILTCCATHGYLPLLGTDESVRAQIEVGVATYRRHFGADPRGIWIPECGYRPAGQWSFPVQPSGANESQGAFQRIGVEQALSESGLRFFIVDTHLVEQSARLVSPYERHLELRNAPSSSPRSLYRPYRVASTTSRAQTTIFARDPHTGLQVWSGDAGYPGDSHYLDFHKKRWPGGHRYWRVTSDSADLAFKESYDAECAAERIRSHADHFVHTVWESLSPAMGRNTGSFADQTMPPVLCAPFDAELFGHWWFEGVAWLEAVIRIFHEHTTGIELISSSSYLDRFPVTEAISMPEGSWGTGGDNQAWLNDETRWTYQELYAAELFCRDFCSSTVWRHSDSGQRLAKQLCRELLLLESSDWQFLITTGAARDYAEQRFLGHLEAFNHLRSFCSELASGGALTPESAAELAAIEEVDNIFPDLDPLFWTAPSQTGSSGSASPARRMPVDTQV